ncbi:MAG: DUF202 domain-containing protein [Planctomycetes bacterium]|nr:DUF202 domain-containing protein [Planctomycetota bacterium]
MLEEELVERTAVPVDIPTKLAIERTRVAYERTIMAAIRTATSLITFGFTVHKFFQLDLEGKASVSRWVGPYEFGVLLILMGLISLLFSWIEYSRDIKMIRSMDPALPRSTAGYLAAMLAFLGLVLLVISVLEI